MLEQFTEDLNIIQKLGDNPNTDDFLSAEQLKEKFDQAGNRIKDYLNGQVVPQVNDALNNKGTFIAEYGVSVWDEISLAVAEKKAVFARKGSVILPLVAIGASSISFSGYFNDWQYTFRLTSDGWEEDNKQTSQVFYAKYGITSKDRIMEKYDAGFACFCVKDTEVLPFVCKNREALNFGFAGIIHGKLTEWYIRTPNADTEEWVEKITELPPIMVVHHTFAPGGGTADKTYAEIREAYDAGKLVLVMSGFKIYKAMSVQPSGLSFNEITTGGGKRYGYSVSTEDVWTRTEDVIPYSTTTITENSGDTELPTSKAVYDFVMEQLEAMPNAAEVGY